LSTRLVLGGARSGKSRFAVQSVPPRARVVLVATAQPGDPDMARRIARHRAERPAHWTTVEAPFDLCESLEALPSRTDAVVVDCLTLWVANLQLRGDGDDVVLAHARSLASLIRGFTGDLTLVSNEVGEGVHPETAAGLVFRDLLGLVNQEVAAACDTVVLMVAGIPLTVKSTPPQPLHGDRPEAP
jgi:adenosylcobinamide kinase/adenosylcobinamide-phosphate guanylyltransferase